MANKPYFFIKDYECNYDIRNKRISSRDYVFQMLNSVSQMFKYEGLPDSIPERDAELMIKMQGVCCVARTTDGELHILGGSLGGEPNVYYVPTRFIGANPVIGSYDYIIDKECVLIYNDSTFQGLLPLFERYAVMLTENDISLYINDIQSRIISLITAEGDSAKKAADKYLFDIINGNLSIVASPAFIEGVKSVPYQTSSHNSLTDLIEHHQYLVAGWRNEVGINSNYNMKRERIQAPEVEMNNDAIRPRVTDMLECRKRQWKKVNEMFGTNITVELGDMWKEHEFSQLNMEGGDESEVTQNEPSISDTE